MTLVFIGGQFAHIECNICGKAAPSAADMAARHSHGIVSEGWSVPPAGGIHLCPEHTDAADVATAAPRHVGGELGPLNP